MNRLRTFLRSRAGRLAVHDLSLAAAAGVTAWQAAGADWTWGAFTAAGVIAAKALLRLVLPVPAGHKPLPAHKRIGLLPAPSGRKGGALPSPRDDRDFKAALPKKIPSSVDFGEGIVWKMLLNDQVGDCYPVALLHALQVLVGYKPTNADALAIYEQATGFDPTRTDAHGHNPTDNGTAARQLYDWARAHGLIESYAAVPLDRASIRAAIAGHKAVLCEWALPKGASIEGENWTMPVHGNKVAGSWGGHATVEVGYTPRHNRNVTWGEEGTVTGAFEDAYLVAAWVVTPADHIAAAMAQIRAS